MDNLTKTFRTVLKAAVWSRRELAQESGYSKHTFDRYMSEKRPSADSALALAHTLEKRAATLKLHAAALREVVVYERHQPALPEAGAGTRRPADAGTAG